MGIEYYGTDLLQAGHHFWVLDGGFNRNLSKYESFPFNPESLPYAGRKKEYVVGTVRFYNFAGFTICAISGSCSDDRGGSKSIFFVQEDLTHDDFKATLLADKTVQKIIKQMPFQVKW